MLSSLDGLWQCRLCRRHAGLTRNEVRSARQEQQAAELDAALSHLRVVRDSYWDRDWRRDHRGFGRYPENEPWEAVDAYLELRDAAESRPGATAD